MSPMKVHLHSDTDPRFSALSWAGASCIPKAGQLCRHRIVPEQVFYVATVVPDQSQGTAQQAYISFALCMA